MTAAPPTSELAAFIEARLSEDEAAARAAETVIRMQRQGDLGPMHPSGVRHLPHDPARVLAEVAALRAVVELHSPLHECNYDVEGMADPWAYDPRYGTPCPTLRHLAAIWASDPAFDPAWSHG